MKEYHCEKLARINMQIISNVYTARLINVEHGRTNFTFTTTSVGWQLVDALRANTVTKDNALVQIAAAVDQLHGIGVAHCDICVKNIFVSLDDSRIFLGDLEYCQDMHLPPPVGIKGRMQEHLPLRNQTTSNLRCYVMSLPSFKWCRIISC